MLKGNFDNTLRLVRFILRRERVISVIWIVSLVLFSVALAPGIGEMFPDAEGRQQFAQVYDNPVMVSMMGPIYGADNYTQGAMYSGMMLLWYIIAVAVMNVFLIVRHTRADEEYGRVEVVRSLPVGRLSNINAAMITAVIVNAVLAIFTGLGLAVIGIESMGFGGCMLYGAVSGAAGLVFAAITAVFCQLSHSTSGATGLSFFALGGFYMLRAVGDITANAEFLSLISPLGLAQRSQVFIANTPVPLIVLLIEAIVIAGVAYKLNSVRDMGQGFIPAKPGKSYAEKWMLSPFGLSLRLLRKSSIVWIVVMFLLGASYGSVMGNIDQFIGGSSEYLSILGIDAEYAALLSDSEKNEFIVEGFGGYIASMMTLLCLVPVMLSALKIRSEEKLGRLENVISRSVSKQKYMLGFVTISFALSVVLQFAVVLGLYTATSAATETNPFSFGKLLWANMAYLPAIWVVIGLIVLITGLFPKATAALWGYYGFVCLLAFMGNFDVFPVWVKAMSPMTHVPELRVTDTLLYGESNVSYVSLLVMTAIAALYVIVGFVQYGERDMTS